MHITVEKVIGFNPERAEMSFRLTLCQRNETFVNASEWRENTPTFIFHEDSRMPIIVEKVIRLASERAQNILG